MLEGEIDMLLDDTQVHMKAGDIMVQQATNHAWVNTSGKPCRICFVLIDLAGPAGVEEGLEAGVRQARAIWCRRGLCWNSAWRDLR